MAAWQFDLNAVCVDGGRCLPLLLKQRARLFLDGLFQTRANEDGLIIYGATNGNRIDLISDDVSCALEIHVDTRSDADSFVALVCILMAELNCTLYSYELHEFISTDLMSIKDALQWSKAWHYAPQSVVIL